MLGRWEGRIGVGPGREVLVGALHVWRAGWFASQGRWNGAVAYIADHAVVQRLVSWLVEFRTACYTDEEVWVVWRAGHDAMQVVYCRTLDSWISINVYTKL